MIDIQQLAEERPLNLLEAAAYIGKLTGNKKPNVSTLYRWCMKGCRGVKLDSVCIGGKRFVTVSAIERFIEAGSRSDASATPLASPAQRPIATHVERHSTRRREEIEAARRRLDAMTRASRPQGPPV